MTYIADTNVVSELVKKEPSQKVIDWFWDHEGEIYLTSITVMELYRGILRLPKGKRREKLSTALKAIMMDCADKTLSFDPYSAYLCAHLCNDAVNSGRTPSIEDMMIASISKRNNAVLATRNTKDFDYLEIDLINPFE